MKSPDEIKKALECCFYDSAQCGECPYYPVSCDRELVRDAREYIRQLESKLECSQMTIDGLTATLLKCDTIIQQLEAERDAAVRDMHEAQACLCLICKNYKRDQDGNEIGCKVFGDFPFEDSPIICGQFEWRGVTKEE